MTDDERYAAIRARDARFDGMFFTCVRSTGIFCRPSCPARTPSRGGVEFVPSAAAAVAAGFRACKRCGPTAPPGSPDANPAGSLAGRALRLLEAGALDGEGTVPALAARLAVSERTLHRALVDRTGAGALAHARILRARRAHELVTGTDLPLARIAHAAGFGSERQFHDTFTTLFGHAPSVVRERQRPARPGAADGPRTDGQPGAMVTARLALRGPFDGAGLADWFAHRTVPGVEELDGLLWTRALRLPHGPAVVRVDLAGPAPLTARLALADLRDHAAAIAAVRHLLDLDADPVGIDAGLVAALPALAPLVAARPGVRLPGAPSPREALLWAITGQQITTSQAAEQITRATDLLEEELPEALHLGSVRRLPVDSVRAAERAEEWFRGPGARRRTLTTAVPAPGLDAAAGPSALRERLLALHGVGPWTADYVLLRGARAVDVAPPRDAALLTAAKDLGLAQDHTELTAALRSTAPWRSYACLHLWHHAAALRRAGASSSTPHSPTHPPAPHPTTPHSSASHSPTQLSNAPVEGPSS